MDNYASTKYILSQRHNKGGGLFIVFPNRHYTEYLTLRLLRTLASVFYRPGYR